MDELNNKVMILLFWILLVIAVAVWADNKGVSVGWAVVISAIFSPLVGAIYVAVSNPDSTSD